MYFKRNGWKINTNSLVRVEWQKYFPKLVVHEKYEKYIKWTLRILTIIGVATSLVSLSPIGGIALSIILLLVEQFFEKTLFEYTVFYIQKFPDFEVDYSQWKTNGFAFPQYNIPGITPIVGPAYSNEEYAIKFFRYIKSWDSLEKEDKNNSLILSFVVEQNGHYTTYIYRNHNVVDSKEDFEKIEEKYKFEKYGKQQQKFVAQMAYLKLLPFKKGSMFDQFLKWQKNGEPFLFAPFVVNPDGSAKCIMDEAVKKFEYKFSIRADLKPNDLEFHVKYD